MTVVRVSCKSFAVWRGVDRGSAALLPRKDECLALFGADDLDALLFGVESAPYFAEFVANSCSRSARLEIAEPEIARLGPTMVNLSVLRILECSSSAGRDDGPNERM